MQTIHARIAVSSRLEPHHRLSAQRLVLAGYATLAGKELSIEEVAEDLFPARASESINELCVVARVNDVILATGTVSFPKRPREVTEALHLFECDAGWDVALQMPAESVAELGRFAMAPILQRNENRDLSATIVREAVSTMLNYARDMGLRGVVAVMPPATMRMTAKAGLRFRPVNEARLATNDAKLKRMFEKYPRYWLPVSERLRPRLYRFEFPT